MEKTKLLDGIKTGMMGNDRKIDLLKKKIKIKKIGHLVKKLEG